MIYNEANSIILYLFEARMTLSVIIVISAGFEPNARDRFYHSPNSNPVLFFKILFLRPDQDNGQVQMDAKVRLAVEPIRINLDQDTAFHLVKYFTGKNFI